MKHVTCDIFVKFFDFLRKIRISVEPKRHTMHLIFLPTLKLQGTEGSQGLHRSFPRCLPHLRSEVKNGCISNTYLEQNVPWHHELHWTMRRKIVNKRHGCYFLVASSLTTLKIGNPETNTEWTPLKINDFQGRAISFRKCNKCWHQEKTTKNVNHSSKAPAFS